LLGDFEGKCHGEGKTCEMIRALGFDGAHLFDMIGGQGLDVAECLTNSIFLRKCQAEDGTIGS